MKNTFRLITIIFFVPMLASCLPTPEPTLPLPACRTFPFSLKPPNVTVTPLLVNGNPDFEGNGPTVDLQLQLQNQGDHLFVRFYMRVEETDANGSPINDASLAEAWYEAPIWFPPQGIRITNIFIDRESSFSYRDKDEDLDIIVPTRGPVAEFQVVGDTAGADIGSDTRAVAVFQTFDIELQQTEACE